ncbi:hypothetical protein BGW36DRAFT_298767 [Talaromyces proteolyticus]|uniref:Uncharacterized protein n=1 Tax=Talaromyces proteolyticus TaxID=1131652 RepID=A0AAD4PWX2_9EURO|nr:uncharacterized protein BGW36DRAFT_298767 [Talaromyces proteolyticus]KAH8695560.1 hypothetical protein BGW36DRAFT_298767 [Talaromyces proteolyticus]
MTRTHSTVPVLFASPEFASWTDPSSSLLAEWVNPLLKSIHHRELPSVVYTVVAVVDKISTLQSNRPRVPLGAAGLSLLLVDSSAIAVSASQPAHVRSSSPAEPAFFFSTPRTSDSAENEDDNQYAREVGLRLTNTIFVNGKDRTLLGLRWIYDAASKGYVLDNWKDLSICDIRYPASEARSSITVPLRPVTQRRSVVSSMGNILRQLSSKSSPIPASSELEKELPRYVSELGIPHQRVAVWALVEPLNALLSEKYGRNDLNQSILNGNRIHRVVSGGGGWGKKQGLLSLDPEVSFWDQFTSSQQNPVSLDQTFVTQSPHSVEPDDNLDISELLGQGLEEDIASLSHVAPVGDNIQFFVATEPEVVENNTELPEDRNNSPLSCSFAVGASVGTELTIPSSSSQDTSSDDMVVIPNHFGGLSETAISYSTKSSGLSPNGRVCRTKLSVPGSRVEIFCYE